VFFFCFDASALQDVPSKTLITLTTANNNLVIEPIPAPLTMSVNPQGSGLAKIAMCDGEPNEVLMSHAAFGRVTT
jgi:hypothetical protein